MATHSSILAWRIPWTEETGRLVCRAAKSQTRMKRLSICADNYNEKNVHDQYFVNVLAYCDSLYCLWCWYNMLLYERAELY